MVRFFGHDKVITRPRGGSGRLVSWSPTINKWLSISRPLQNLWPLTANTLLDLSRSSFSPTLVSFSLIMSGFASSQDKDYRWSSRNCYRENPGSRYRKVKVLIRLGVFHFGSFNITFGNIRTVEIKSFKVGCVYGFV